MLTLQGKIVKIKETEYKGEKQYPVKEFYFIPSNTFGDVPICFTTLGKKTSLLENLSENDEIIVKFVINGLEQKDKIYNTLNVIDISLVASAPKDKETPKEETNRGFVCKRRDLPF